MSVSAEMVGALCSQMDILSGKTQLPELEPDFSVWELHEERGNETMVCLESNQIQGTQKGIVCSSKTTAYILVLLVWSITRGNQTD